MSLPRVASPEAIAAALAAKTEMADHAGKLHGVPSHVDKWMEASGGLQGQRVLEIGCGAGLISAGIALGYGAAVVYGVDRCLSDGLAEVLDALGLPMPVNLVLQRQVEATDLPDLPFDVVFAWSALSLLDLRTLTSLVAAIYRATAIGGRVLVQEQRLFYSPNGARLQEHGLAPWAHLTMSRPELRAMLQARLKGDQAAVAAALDRADNLPRLASGTLAEVFRDAGFHLVRRYVTRVPERPPTALTCVFQLDALTEDQALLLFSKN